MSTRYPPELLALRADLERMPGFAKSLLDAVEARIEATYPKARRTSIELADVTWRVNPPC